MYNHTQPEVCVLPLTFVNIQGFVALQSVFTNNVYGKITDVLWQNLQTEFWTQRCHITFFQ